MTVLEANIAVLKNRDPEAFERIFNKITPDGNIEIIPSTSGVPTATYMGNYLHSPRDPVREAEKFVKGWDSSIPRILIIEGFGLGYHARAFLAAYPDLTIWIIEPDISIFYKVLSETDMQDLLGHPRLILFFKPAPHELGMLASEAGHKSFGIAKVRSVYEKDREYYEEIDREIHGVISRKTVNENTLKRFGKLWVKNLIKNIPVLPKVKGIYRLKDKFKGFPVLIVAAGPSLEEVLPYIRELYKRFLIISVDTAYGSLKKAGIFPDFITIVDPQYWNTRHLDGLNLSETILISESSANPRLLQSGSENIYFSASLFPLNQFLEERTDIRGRLSPGGSVATAAWESARYMGASEIICGGLDLGFPGGQTHHRESFFEMRALYNSDRTTPMETLSYKALNEASPHPVLNYEGGLTLTDQRMEVYKRWFESQLKRYPDLPVFNITGRSIAIAGIKPINIGKLLDRPETREELNRIVDSLKGSSDQEKDEELLNRIENLKSEFRQTEEFGKRGLALSGELEGKIKAGESLGAVIYKLDKLDEEILSSSVKNMAGFLFQEVIGGITEDSDRTGMEINRAAENSKKIYSEILKASRFHLDLLAVSINKL